MIPVSLHTHTKVGSNDGSLTPRQVARLYRDKGFGAVAFTDHDVYTDAVDVPGILTLSGVEHTIDAADHVHMVEIPALDLRFLAHPKFFSGMEDVKPWIEDFAYEYDIDGVEKFNGTEKQFSGHIPGLLEFASDDAHNHFQAGHSYIEVPVMPDSPAHLADMIHSADYELVHEPDPLSYKIGLANKGYQVIWNEFARALGNTDLPGKETVLYERDDERRY